MTVLAVDGKSKIAIQVFNKKGKPKKRIKESVETRRERKAWRTLAIITGTFVACWTPFFLLSLYRPLCGCRIPPLLESVTLWLGKKI
jgi:5-hydroxytryptamine receptor 1